MSERVMQEPGKGKKLSRVVKPLSIAVTEKAKHDEPVRSRSSLFKAEAFEKLPYDNLEDACIYYDTTMNNLVNVRNGALKQRYDNILATQFPLKNRYTNILPYLRTQPIALYLDKFLVGAPVQCNDSTDSSLAGNGTILDESNSFTNMSSYQQSISYISENEVVAESKSPLPDNPSTRKRTFPMTAPGKGCSVRSPRQPEDFSLIPPTPCTAKALSPEEQETEHIYMKILKMNLMIRYFNGNIVFLNGLTFLITQAPTIASMADFWYIIFSLKVVFIANLTRFIDDERPKAIRYWPLYKNKDSDPLYKDSVKGSYLHYAYQKAQDTNNPRAGQMFKQFYAYIKTVQEEIPEDSLFWNCTRMKLSINAIISDDAIGKSDAIGFSTDPMDGAEVEDDEGDDPLTTNISVENVHLSSSPVCSGNTGTTTSEQAYQPEAISRTTVIHQQLTLGSAAMKCYRDQFFGYKIGIKCNRETHFSKLYYYGLWSDYSIPDNFEIIFLFSVEALRYKNRGPLCIHCSAGVGRSSTFAICIVITNMLIQNFQSGREFVKEEDVREQKVWRSFQPSILEMTEMLRVQRNPLCVQTSDQFVFLHDYCNFAYHKLKPCTST